MINRLIRRFVPLVYIVLVLISILLVLKPGSSIFFYKSTMKRAQIDHDSGYSYRYLLTANPLVFAHKGILVYEDGRLLELTPSTQVVNRGGGNFSLSDPSSKKFYIYFSTSDNSDPRIGNRNYKIYYPVIFLSRNMGFIYLAIFSLGIIWFLLFVLKSATLRHSLKISPASIIHIFDNFIDQEVNRVISPIIKQLRLDYTERTALKKLLKITIGSAYFYVFMEWLFFVTKPSLMDLMGWFQKVEILLISGFIIAMVSGILLLVFFGFDLLFSRVHIFSKPIYISAVTPTTLFSITTLLLVDNFTYTVFKFGIVSTDGIWRGAYGLAFIISFIYIYTRVLAALSLKGETKPKGQTSRISSLIISGLLVVSIILVFVQVGNGQFKLVGKLASEEASGNLTKRPNILLIASDGLNAENLSVYGYKRDTTPTLRQLAQDSLLAENAFPNAAHSSGSDISVLTGKNPTKTRVLYPPDILKGADAYQHLPGILRKMGYFTVELGVTHYVDAYQMNLLDGFDRVNQSTFNENEVIRFVREQGAGDSVYFTSSLIQRVSARLFHIFFIQTMVNPYTIITQPISQQSDRERLVQLETLIRESDRPLFVHVHMMSTHGPKFYSEQQVFSKGETQDGEWMVDFYDDGILNFDRYVGELLDTLKTTDKLSNTVIIIYSDHGMKYLVWARTPLIIHFPNHQYVGRIQNNVQNLDIAPTILDYLGLPQPNWMDGRSLLRGEPPEHRLIFSSGISYAVSIGQGYQAIDPSRAIPPFYQFEFLNVIDCNHWYLLDLIQFNFKSGMVAGHTAPCAEGSMLTMVQAKAEIVKHLAKNGFDVSKFP